MITLDLSILNQKGTPMFYSDIFANRPAAGVVGRIFISTDTYAIYRDTGSAWNQIGGSGSGITGSGTAGTLPIWTSSSALGDSAISEAATLITATKDFQINGYVYAVPTLTAANNASSLAIYGQNTLSYAAGFSSNNIGAIYSAIGGVNLQTFAGSATFAQANLASGGISVNSIDFSSAGSTITMTQSSGIRAMTGIQNQIQYQGTNSATISHAAISQNLGFYRPSGATGTLTITNAYSHLINALDDYGAGFTFTNRWGIYQAGASDTNYFASNTLIGSNISTGEKLQVTGSCRINGQVNIFDTTQSTSSSTGCLILNGGLGIAKNIFSNGNIITNAGTIAALNGGTFEIYNSGSSNYFDLKSVGGNFALRTNVGIGAVNALTISGNGDAVFSGAVSTINWFLVSNTINSYAYSNFGANSGYGWQIGKADNSGGIAPANGFYIYDLTNSLTRLSISTAGNIIINSINDPGQRLYLNGSLRIDGQSSGTAGGSSGQHLIINCDGTTYKIALLNP